MNDMLSRRTAALIGLMLAAALALWWLGITRIAFDGAADASRSSAQTLHAAWLARGMVLMLLVLRTGALHGWRGGAAAALGLTAPAWPVVALAWLASATPLTSVLLAELALLAAGASAALVGLALQRALRHAERAEVVATGLGIVLAACIWAARGAWTALAS
jgi:hypothetical protein